MTAVIVDDLTDVLDDIGTGNADCQVILYNDNHNTFDFVVDILMSIFGHPAQLAEKMAMEAHTQGRAIVEFTDEQTALEHCNELRGVGLGSDVEKV